MAGPSLLHAGVTAGQLGLVSHDRVPSGPSSSCRLMSRIRSPLRWPWGCTLRETTALTRGPPLSGTFTLALQVR